jgi:hypothetical protein
MLIIHGEFELYRECVCSAMPEGVWGNGEWGKGEYGKNPAPMLFVTQGGQRMGAVWWAAGMANILLASVDGVFLGVGLEGGVFSSP